MNTNGRLRLRRDCTNGFVAICFTLALAGSVCSCSKRSDPSLLADESEPGGVPASVPATIEPGRSFDSGTGTRTVSPPPQASLGSFSRTPSTAENGSKKTHLREKIDRAIRQIGNPASAARDLREVFVEDLYQQTITDPETGEEAIEVPPVEFRRAVIGFKGLVRASPPEAAAILSDPRVPMEITPELLSEYVKAASETKDGEFVASAIAEIEEHDLRQQAIFAYTELLLQSFDDSGAVAALETVGLAQGEESSQYVGGAASDANGKRWAR